MTKALLIICLFLSSAAFGQYRPEKMECFEAEIDSIILRAAKDSCSINVIITPFEGKRIASPNSSPLAVVPITWTKVLAYDDMVGESNITWTFINDSLVRQEMDGREYYGLISREKIYQYDIEKNKIISYGNYLESDSSGFKIIERSFGAGKDTLSAYWKSIYDSSGRLVELYPAHSGKIYNFQTFQYFGDTLFLMKTYYPKRSNNYNIIEWKVIQNDSFALTGESYDYRIISDNHRSRIDSSVTITFSIDEDRKPFVKTNITRCNYDYDSEGRLLKAEMESNSMDWYWKNVMIVTYGDRRKKKN